MILKILKEYIRRISRTYKIYIISILGMSIAIIGSFHIYHFVFKELSVDSFHDKKNDLYRITEKRTNSNFIKRRTYLRLGELLKKDLPEVVDYTRVVPKFKIKIKHQGTEFADEITYIDPSFFSNFSFNLKQGNIEEFKSNMNGLILSESKAKELFGDKSPLGKTINIQTLYEKAGGNYSIIGIINDIPINSTIQGDVFVNIKKLENYYEPHFKKNLDWVGVGPFNPEVYLYMPHLKNKRKVIDYASNIIVEKFKSSPYFTSYEKHFELDLQPLKDIYFTSNNVIGQDKKGDYQFIKIISLVGILGLFLAIANYIIMSLGLKFNRSEELKAKRYLGASKSIIFLYLIIESLFNATICLIITLVSYPYISNLLAHKIGFVYKLELEKDYIIIIVYVIILIAVSFMIALLEYVLSYRTIFKGEMERKKQWFSKQTLIGFQLLLLLTLVMCIAFVSKQVDYIKNTDLGLNIENVASIETKEHDVELKNFLLTKSYIKNISYSNGFFSKEKEDVYKLFHQGSNNEIATLFKNGDNNCLDVFNLKLLTGRNLSPKENLPQPQNNTKKTSSSIIEAIVNETFVNKTNLKNPIGEIFKTEYGQSFEIVGVFKDVHTAPLYYPKEPIILFIDYSQWYNGLFQVSFDRSQQANLIEDVKSFFTKKGYDSILLGDSMNIIDLKDIYKKELQLKSLC